MPDVPPDVATHCVQEQDHGIADAVDWEILKRVQPALDDKTPVEISISIRNPTAQKCAETLSRGALAANSNGVVRKPLGTVSLGHVT